MMNRLKTNFKYILFALLLSCEQEKVRKISFESIDLTFSNGWTKMTSVYIDSNKIIKVRIDEHLSKLKNYRDTLPDSVFCKISEMTKKILMKKHDSIIGSPAPDAGGYSFLLNSKMGNINTMVFNYHGYYKLLDTIVFYILDFAKKVKINSTDIHFNYKSLKKFAPPPMESSNVIFVPPAIKEDSYN
jgi:hypothetical protein